MVAEGMMVTCNQSAVAGPPVVKTKEASITMVEAVMQGC